MDQVQRALITHNLARRLDTTVIGRELVLKGDGIRDLQWLIAPRPEIDLGKWYDTYDGVVDALPDWYELQWATPIQVRALLWTHGPMFVEGGWWTTLAFEYLDEAGAWQPVTAPTFVRPYDFGNGRHERRPFETFVVSFEPVTTRAIRLIGQPGGLLNVTTMQQLAAFDLDVSGWAADDLPSAPLPDLFDVLEPNRLWDLMSDLGDVVGLHIDAQSREGLGLEHFLSADRLVQFHQHAQQHRSGQMLQQMIGDADGWDRWTAEVLVGRERAYATKQPQVHLHHGGLVQVVSPVVVNDQVIGTIESRSPVLSATPDLAWHIAFAARLNLNISTYLQALRAVPVVPTATLAAAAQLLMRLSDIVVNLTRDDKLRTERLNALDAALREQQAASQLQAYFLSHMSHELRTPLTAILGYTQMLNLEVLGSLHPEQREALKLVEQHSRHLLDLVGDVLDINKLDSGISVATYVPIALADLATEIGALAASLIGPAPLAFELRQGADLPPVLMTDQGRLTQLLRHLLSNAVKFTPRGGIMVELGRPDPTHWQVIIRDTGIGIAPDHLAKVWNEFYQADHSETRAYGGAGLGLAIVRRLVTMLDSRIGLESTLDEGTTVTVTLPLLLPGPAEPAAGTALA